MNLRFHLTLLALLCAGSSSFSQNLITNPGAESPTSSGWTIVTQGTPCYTSDNWRIMGNQNGFPVAHEGNYYFFSGCNSVNGEIYQVIDVSSLAADIDADNRNFTFSGFVQSSNEEPADGAYIKIEYQNASNASLVSYSTGITKNKGVWKEYTSTLTAPPGTRKVKITLKSFAANGSSVDAYFDDLSLTSTQILPLKLISFTTTVDRENAVIASWKTANELNNDHFELQRSKDGHVWEGVATVKGSGTTSAEHSYYASDRFPFAGLSYYRLVQVDFDGKMSVSKINSVKVAEKELSLLAYPNPATNSLTLEGKPGSLLNFQFYNTSGQNVTSQIRFVRQNSSKTEFNISTLSQGVYYIKSQGKTLSFYKQ